MIVNMCARHIKAIAPACVEGKYADYTMHARYLMELNRPYHPGNVKYIINNTNDKVWLILFNVLGFQLCTQCFAFVFQLCKSSYVHRL